MNEDDEGANVKQVVNVNMLNKKENIFDFAKTGRFPAKSLVVSRSPSIVKEDGSEIEYTTTKKISITPFQEIEKEEDHGKES